MTSFTDDFAEEAVDDLLAVYGENVVYRPVGGGSARTISAVVQRTQQERGEEYQADIAERIELFVEKQATTGITAAQLQLGDLIDWNGNSYSHRGEIVNENAAAWTLIFEKTRPWLIGGGQTQAAA